MHVPQVRKSGAKKVIPRPKRMAMKRI
jgi:hypothetical protein